MRSPAEVSFRIQQELSDLYYSTFPPKLRREAGRPSLPNHSEPVERLRPTAFATEVVGLADGILQHRFPIFGGVIENGEVIRWRRDPIHHIESPPRYARRIPYLDFHCVGDHKYVWELNRHQHLIVLAQAFCLTGDDGYLGEIVSQVESWLNDNPFLRGINWTSALEAAFRALSWLWVDHLAGGSLPPPFRRKVLQALYQHGCFIERNLSIYFSPNTHLLGEAVALHALGALYSEFPRSARWRSLGGEIARAEMLCQVRADGAHFEQSTYYHVYALDFFLFNDLLSDHPLEYREKLCRMAEYLDALLGPAGRIPLIGDDDGGRLFHPYGERAAFGRATLATCGARFGRREWIRSREDLHEQAAWWLGAPAWKTAPGHSARSSRLFPDAGVAVMSADDVHIVIKAGPFGPLTAGHSHSDVLSFTCRQGAAEILIDPGTYTYLSDPEWRNYFRGSAAHNTLRIDGRDQATPAGPFRWQNPPEVRICEWTSAAQRDVLDAECRFAGYVHRRRFVFLKPRALLIFDYVQGPPGSHLVEQFWHGTDDSDHLVSTLALSHPSEAIEGWRSRVYGHQEPSSVRRVTCRGPLPVAFAALIGFRDRPQSVSLERAPGGYSLTVKFSDDLIRECVTC